MPPPVTPLMLIRSAEGAGIDYRWQSLSQISKHLARAVIAAEDGRFCEHWGVDFTEAGNAVDEWLSGERLRGASTLSMQTTKNVLLWPERNLFRKALEIWLTPQLELLWSKRRILEVYLNVAEMGPGIYGAEAAARKYFGKPASRLTPNEAALIAAILPNPRHWSPAAPTEYLLGRAEEISARAAKIDAYTACIG
jgi:monofunctional biosynthetic peptidoglycan transglycosylase